MAERRRKSLNRLVDRENVYRALAHTVAECSPHATNRFMTEDVRESARQTAGILLNIASSRGFPICPDKRERQVAVRRSIQEIFAYFTRILAGGPPARNLETAAKSADIVGKVTPEQIQATSRWGALMLEPSTIRTIERFLADLPEKERKTCLHEAFRRIVLSDNAPAQQELLDILQIASNPNAVH